MKAEYKSASAGKIFQYMNGRMWNGTRRIEVCDNANVKYEFRGARIRSAAVILKI